MFWMHYTSGMQLGKCHSMSQNATTYVRFANKQNIVNYTYHIHNHELEKYNVMTLEFLSTTSLLGLLTLTTQLKKLHNGTLYFLVQNFKRCTPDVKLKCYLPLVHPILEYASHHMVTLPDNFHQQNWISSTPVISFYFE